MKVYSKLNEIPKGHASDIITPGCLVQEGGAFKGVYGEGAQDALMKEGINLECAVGVSAGAVNGFNYISGQLGRPARLNLKYRHHWRYVGLYPLLRDGNAIGFSFMFSGFAEEEPLDIERFNSPDRRFVAVATDARTGETVYLERGRSSDIFKAIRASSAMAYLARPVNLDGLRLLDGACSVKIPYRWALDQGYEKIIVVHARLKGSRRDEKPSRLTKICYPFSPRFQAALDGVNAKANQDEQELMMLEEDGRLINIYPSKDLGVSHLEKDVEKLGELYWLGYNDTLSAMPRIKAYLAKSID